MSKASLQVLSLKTHMRTMLCRWRRVHLFRSSRWFGKHCPTWSFCGFRESNTLVDGWVWQYRAAGKKCRTIAIIKPVSASTTASSRTAIKHTSKLVIKMEYPPIRTHRLVNWYTHAECSRHLLHPDTICQRQHKRNHLIPSTRSTKEAHLAHPEPLHLPKRATISFHQLTAQCEWWRRFRRRAHPKPLIRRTRRRQGRRARYWCHAWKATTVSSATLAVVIQELFTIRRCATVWYTIHKFTDGPR